ncbi:hypothetical protein GEMRC1_006782 [Eukaryota sp. GEM-RC1]
MRSCAVALKRSNAFLANYFSVEDRGGTLFTEFVAGILQTIVTISVFANYPLFVSSVAEEDHSSSFEGSLLMSLIFTILSSTYANAPVIFTPQMSQVFEIQTLLNIGFSFKEVLGVLFTSGVLYFLIVVSGVIKLLLTSLSKPFWYNIVLTIELFLCLLGLIAMEVLVQSDSGEFHLGQPSPIFRVSVIGLFLLVF